MIKVIFSFFLLAVFQYGYAQDVDQQYHLSSRKGATSLGLGIGLPYGAIGIRIGSNLVDGLNLFGGVGYMISGVGYNIGLRKEFVSSALTQFYLTGMYGANGAIKIEGLSEYNKVYSGPSFGLGIKVNSRRTEGNYWDFGLLVPVRSSSFKNDVELVEQDPRIIDFRSPSPVLLVIGYNFNL